MQVKIKGEKAQIEFASLLIANGYTVRITTAMLNNKKVKVVEYWEGEQKQ